MTPDLFGNVRPLEPANVYVLPTKTLADEIRAELRLAAAIRANPFSHLPAKIMPPIMGADRHTHKQECEAPLQVITVATASPQH